MIDRPIYARVCRTQVQIEKAAATLAELSIIHADTPLEIVISKWQPKRTGQQNRYLFGVVYAIISQETGNEVNDLHDYFLGEFFGWEEFDVMGRKKVRPRERSSKQLKARFSEYLEFVISRAASLGIVIPPPNNDLPESMK